MRRWMLAVAVAALLMAAGCGTDEDASKSDEASAPVVPKGKVKGSLTIAQWPLYIDPGKKGTIAEFEKATGVDVRRGDQRQRGVLREAAPAARAR
jgi:ABC-type glycerol-3-phosphate transport system substrate-binding protein